MPWQNHPSYVRARDRVIQRFRARAFTFQHLRPVVFLCGGSNSPRRETIRTYLRQHHPDILVFYAELVWDHLAAHHNIDALKMEEELGHLADILVILVESPGTFAELGAFALSPALDSKVLPILDRKYRGDKSFINTGPVRYLDSRSRYSPCIYADFEAILTSMTALEDRLGSIPDRGPLPASESAKSVAERPKRLLFLLCDILAVIGPATEEQCSTILASVLPEKPVWTTAHLLGLAATLNLVTYHDLPIGRVYSRTLSGADLPSFLHQRRMFDLANERARFLEGAMKSRHFRSCILNPEGGVRSA